MATINAGRVRPYYRGAWASGNTYSFFDLVTSGGNSYLCINTSGSPAGTAVTNTTYWALIAQKGATGATGATGPQGPAGPSGAATVTLKGTRTTSGNWSITGLAVGKPLYIIASCSSSTASSNVFAQLDITSGTNDVTVLGNNTHFKIGTLAHDDGQCGNSCIVIPTSSTVVINVPYATSFVVLRAYQ